MILRIGERLSKKDINMKSKKTNDKFGFVLISVKDLLKVKVTTPNHIMVFFGDSQEIADWFGFDNPRPGFEHSIPVLTRSVLPKEIKSKAKVEFINDEQFHE